MTSWPQDSIPLEGFSPQAGPAPISAWRDFASDWVAHARASSGRSFVSSPAFGPGGSSWRTFPVSCRPSAPVPAAGSATTRPAQQRTLFEEDPADDEYDEAAPLAPDGAWHSTGAAWVPSSGRWQNSG